MKNNEINLLEVGYRLPSYYIYMFKAIMGTLEHFIQNKH